MSFPELPLRLRVYVLAHLLVVFPVALAVVAGRQPDNWLLVLLLVTCSLIFGAWKVELTVLEGRMTLAFAIVCLSLLLQGTGPAILCAVLGGLMSIFIRPGASYWKVRVVRPEWYRVLFTVANPALSCAVAALTFDLVVRVGPGGELGKVLGLVAFTGVYFLTNTVGVSLVCAFQQGLNWIPVWVENFLWTAPGFFASASAAAAIQALFLMTGPWALICLPPLWVIYYSYRLYMDRIHLFTEKVQQDMTHIQELNRLNQSVIASLATAIDAKDRYTCAHINRVQSYALALARAAGVTGPELEAVATAAVVHDIGKLAIPDNILGKPGKLTPEEFERIQTHVDIGAEILSPVPFPFPVVDMVLTHHERWDGLGYPKGLKAEEIPLGGRIIGIVDVFDALTSNRPYRRALSYEAALHEIKSEAGKQFDPHLVELFEQVLPGVIAEIQETEAATTQADAPAELQGASALDRISQAAAEMAAVSDVAHALYEKETLEEISRVVVNRCLVLLPADTAVLYMANPGEPRLDAVAVEGKYQDKLDEMTIQVGEGVVGWVAAHHQPKVNVSASLDVARRFSPGENIELSAATAVPVMHGPTLFGVLAVYTVGYRVLSDHHLNVLNILAEHAAVAIQNTQRVERHRELAYTDPLTGLTNSRGLLFQLERMIQGAHAHERRGDHFAVIMMDLDRFKEVNDKLGHLRGDDLLRLVAQRLTEVSRTNDIVCRYAGDEFVMLLPSVSEVECEVIAGRIRESINGIPPIDGQVQIGTSVGVAHFPADGTESRVLIGVADRRMYEDKFQRKQSRNAREAAARELAARTEGTAPDPEATAGAR